MISIKPSRVVYDSGLVKGFQSHIGLVLSTDYVDFLKSYNGGTPDLNVVKLIGQEIESTMIRYFFGLGLDSIENLKAQYDLLKDRLPEKCVPIAASFQEFINKMEPYSMESEELEEHKGKVLWFDPDFLKELEGDSEE